MEKKKLRVWWIPQIPLSEGENPFYVPVESMEEAKLILDTLSIYDQYQYQNKIKPDFSNAGGLEQFDEEVKEWRDWGEEDVDDFCEENDIRNGLIDELIKQNNIVF